MTPGAVLVFALRLERIALVIQKLLTVTTAIPVKKVSMSMPDFQRLPCSLHNHIQFKESSVLSSLVKVDYLDFLYNIVSVSCQLPHSDLGLQWPLFLKQHRIIDNKGLLQSDFSPPVNRKVAADVVTRTHACAAGWASGTFFPVSRL